MPIPAFDSILNVLPPHLGDPRDRAQMSPFPCTIDDIVQRFGYSSERKAILEGLITFRLELLSIGVQAVQWLDGSFLEDIESQEGRPPGDVDVVTFVTINLQLHDLHQLIASHDPNLLVRKQVKAKYKVDHFLLPLVSHPWQLVNNTKYFYGLFSHRRDRLWKGMLEVGMSDMTEDQAALATLRSLP
jgi:hypothetical protein